MYAKRLALIALPATLLFACGGPAETEQATGPAPEAETVNTEEAAPAEEAAPVEPRVFFVDLEDGAEVTSPLKVVMGVEGMEIEPAGEVIEGKGHHHLIIDGAFIPAGEVVPANLTHIHFGKGQTETEEELEPGEHTLTLQFADGLHQSFGEAMSATITVTVVAGE